MWRLELSLIGFEVLWFVCCLWVEWLLSGKVNQDFRPYFSGRLFHLEMFEMVDTH